jgi:hypothetical protein
MSDPARAALLEKHYLKRLPPISVGFELWDETGLCAVVTFGVPASRHLQISACPSDPSKVLELNRLWIDDRMPRNTASSFVRNCMRQMDPAIIVSYADPMAGHKGTVYHAMGFYYAGMTDADRKTPRFDYVPTNGKHSRDAFRSGDYVKVRRIPKHKFWAYSGRNKRERHAMACICGMKRAGE